MSELPAGTVTLMFSDIEGSTALLKRLGDGWPDVLKQQRGLLREAVAAGDGVVVDCQGDAMFAAFRSAPSGVAAAIVAQRQHTLAEWPDGTAVRVRMSLHTGEPHLTDEGGYTGIDVVRAARLCAAGHGGQVLLTEATRLISGAETVDLGSTSLPDMDGPEHVYQLVLLVRSVDTSENWKPADWYAAFSTLSCDVIAELLTSPCPAESRITWT